MGDCIYHEKKSGEISLRSSGETLLFLLSARDASGASFKCFLANRENFSEGLQCGMCRSGVGMCGVRGSHGMCRNRGTGTSCLKCECGNELVWFRKFS